MQRFRPLPTILAMCSLSLVALTNDLLAEDGTKNIPVLVSWEGELKIELREETPESGYVADVETWEKLWKSWRPDEELPSVNFDETIILVTAGSDPNYLGVSATIDRDGHVKTIVFSTLVNYSNPTEFRYAFSLIRRNEIKKVNGIVIKDE